jgi:hypothetical protein
MNRLDAIEQNLKTYHSRPCKNCGGTERYVSSYGCVKCTLSRNDSEYIKNYSKTEKARNRIKEYMKEYAADGKVSEVNKKYYRKNTDKIQKYYHNNRDTWFKSVVKRYGITLEEYRKLHEAQDGRCAICNIAEIELSKRMHIDHCHTTGVVRGLLCHHCNTGIGLFKENIEIMRKAMEYLNG